jgi:hypothetical protein
MLPGGRRRAASFDQEFDITFRSSRPSLLQRTACPSRPAIDIYDHRMERVWFQFNRRAGFDFEAGGDRPHPHTVVPGHFVNRELAGNRRRCADQPVRGRSRVPDRSQSRRSPSGNCAGSRVADLKRTRLILLLRDTGDEDQARSNQAEFVHKTPLKVQVDRRIRRSWTARRIPGGVRNCSS